MYRYFYHRSQNVEENLYANISLRALLHNLYIVKNGFKIEKKSLGTSVITLKKCKHQQELLLRSLKFAKCRI